MSRTLLCFERLAKFSNGQDSLITTNVQKTFRTREMMKEVCWNRTWSANFSVELLADKLKVRKYTIGNILTIDLNKRKVCVWFISCALIDKRQLVRIHSGQNVINFFLNKNFLKSIVCNETWFFHCNFNLNNKV